MPDHGNLVDHGGDFMLRSLPLLPVISRPLSSSKRLECRGQASLTNPLAPLCLSERLSACDDTAHQPPTLIDVKFESIRQLVKTHIDQKLDLSTLAAEARLSVSRVYQLFRI